MAIALVLIVFSLSSVGAQTAAVANSSAEPPRHDAWRQEPRALPPSPKDPLELKRYTDRSSYFDAFPGGTSVPLDQPQPERSGGSSSSYGESDELPFFPANRINKEVILVGSFVDYQTHLSASRLSVYTTVHLKVEQVLEPGSSGVRDGETVDLLLDGGTVALPSGKVITYHTYSDLGDFSLQPRHRYILFLDYEKQGDFYLDQKDWEFVDGVAVPDRLDEVTRMQTGMAKYSGLTEAAFIEAVKKAIALHKDAR